MMCFTRLMQILRQTICWLYWFVSSIAKIAIIGGIAYISGRMVVISLSEIYVPIDVRIFYNDSIIYITILLFISICVWLIVFILMCVCILMSSRDGRYRLKQFFRRYFRRNNHQQNHIQNNMHMNGHAYQFQEDEH